MKKINSDTVRLYDILQAIDDIKSYKIKDIKDKVKMNATLYSITIIGEAANKLSATLRKKHKDIPWLEIINMRHRIVHDYGNVNLQTVKEIVENDLPLLRKQIQSLLKH